MTKTMLTILVFNSFFAAHAQKTDSSFTDLKSAEQLSFLIGNWEGEGWIMGQDRKVKRFFQKETVESKLELKALLVDGLGYALDSTGITNEIIHQAFGLISYNAERDKVTMISFTKTNDRMESDLELTDERKFYWSFKLPGSGGTIRFSDDFTENNTWKEIGEFSMDGQNWYQFFEMNLKKK